MAPGSSFPSAWSPHGKTLYADRLEVSFTDADVYAIAISLPPGDHDALETFRLK